MGLIKRNRIAYGTPILDDNVTQGSSNGVNAQSTDMTAGVKIEG